MSLCNKCIKPGSCCNNFVLSGHGFGTEYESEWQEVGAKRVERFGLPFIPIRFEQSATSLKDTDVPPWGMIRYSCSKVTEDGRCSIYATRPQLCRSYKAGSDGLCVMHGRPPFPPDNARLLVSRRKREGDYLGWRVLTAAKRGRSWQGRNKPGHQRLGSEIMIDTLRQLVKARRSYQATTARQVHSILDKIIAKGAS